MNATCPAGIPKPQRVSDLGRLLNPEITAPARLHSTWCLQHQHGACPSARRPLQHPHGAWPSARRPRLAMCEATLHGHTALCVSPNFQKDQLPQRRSVSKETWRLSLISLFEMTNFLIKTDDAHFASRSAHQDRRRTPHVPFGTTQEEFSFAIHQQVLLPALHHHFRHAMQDDAQTRRRRTTRLRVHVDMATRRRSAKARRASCSQWPRGEPTSYETQLRLLVGYQNLPTKTTKLTITRATRPNFGYWQKLPKLTKLFCLAQMRVFRYRFRKPSSVCVAL